MRVPLALPLLMCLAAAPPDGKLHAYFFDVGHGDATLLVSPVGRTVLIDSGPGAAGNHLRLRIPTLAKGALDLVVLTHAGEEHLGAMAELIESVGARRFLDPGLREQGEAHAALIQRMQEQGVQIVLPIPDPETPGELLRIDVGGGVELEVLWPRAPVESLLTSGRKLQANAIVLRAVFGETSLLLMGDAQPETEEYLLKRRYALQSTLLKVSDHGAGASSTLPFLVGARPLAGIISVGPGNPLGAPARAVLQRLQQVGVKVFRTDLDGEVHAVSDGKRFTVSTERLPAGEASSTRWSFPLAPVAAPAPVAVVARPGKVLRLDDVTVPLPVAKKPGGIAKASPADTRPGRPEIKRTAPKGDDGVIALLVARKGEKVFHFADCPAARKIPPKEMVVFTSRGEAARKLKPAGDCSP
ncbi:MAG: metallo-beta-lactamase family protein [Myxococcaceae bacterium]|nr:metallo-beta-lactamase family protein [Myxococcaceae bacterium]